MRMKMYMAQYADIDTSPVEKRYYNAARQLILNLAQTRTKECLSDDGEVLFLDISFYEFGNGGVEYKIFLRGLELLKSLNYLAYSVQNKDAYEAEEYIDGQEDWILFSLQVKCAELGIGELPKQRARRPVRPLKKEDLKLKNGKIIYGRTSFELPPHENYGRVGLALLVELDGAPSTVDELYFAAFGVDSSGKEDDKRLENAIYNLNREFKKCFRTNDLLIKTRQSKKYSPFFSE